MREPSSSSVAHVEADKTGMAPAVDSPCVRDAGPMVRWRALEAEESLLEDVIDLVANEGLSLPQIAKRWRVPHVQLARKFASLPAWTDAYEEALRLAAASIAHEVVEIADEKEEDAPSRKVRIDARRWLAGRLDRARWAESQENSLTVTVRKTPEQMEYELAAILEATPRLKEKLRFIVGATQAVDAEVHPQEPAEEPAI